jgi:hypothetical protein
MTEEIWHNNSRGWYEEETDGMTTTTSQRRKEKEGMRGREGGERGNTEAGRQLRVERRAKRRKLGQQQRAHFLFILLLSE